MRYGNNWLSGAMSVLACAVSGATLLIPSAVTAQTAVRTPKSAVVRKSAGEATLVTKKKALLRDFMGLNVHSVGFKPELYKPVCRLVRDYHPMVWDLDNDTSNATQFPMTRNNINWLNEYGVWNKTGYDIDVSLQFEQTATGKNRETEVVLPAIGGKIVRAEQMPLQAGKAQSVAFHDQGGRVTLKVGESPIYLWIQQK